MPKVGCRPFVFAFLPMAVACGEQSAGRATVVLTHETDSAGVALVTISGRPSDLPEWPLSASLAVLSGDAEPFLGSVGQVRFLSDGRFLVEDSQAELLYLVEADARSFLLVGDQGEGPGEFRDVTTLTVARGDTAFVFDRRLLRVSSLSPDGELIATVPVGEGLAGATRAEDAWATDSDHLVFHAAGPMDTLGAGAAWKDQREALLFSLDGRGRPRSSPVRFTGGYRIIANDADVGRPFIVIAPFANQPIVAVGPDRVVHGSGLTYELFIQSPELQLERVIRWSGPRVATDDATIESARAWAEALYEGLRQQDSRMADVALEAAFAPELLPDSLPALSSVLVDSRGRFWVSRYISNDEAWDQRDAWHILAADGEPLARVSLPPESRLAAVGEDRVALIVRDELDVEHLRVLKLVLEPDG